MNYINLHEKFIEYFKETTPLERMLKRNANDSRQFDDFLYTENHHITPRSYGGSDNTDNMVRLLPEEHIFIHLLRYKAYKTRNDMLAFRFCLNGSKNYTNKHYHLNDILSKKIKTNYAILKNFSYNFRKKHGWQTKQGLKNISKSRKNKIPVYDPILDKIIEMDKNDPRYLSGECKHHTKGWVTMLDTRTNEKIRIKCSERKDYHKILISQEGSNNTNFSGLSDDYLLEIGLLFVKKYNFIPSYNLINMFAKKYNHKFLKSLRSFRFKEFGGGWNGFYKALEEKTNLKYYSGKHNTAERIQRVREIIKDLKND